MKIKLKTESKVYIKCYYRTCEILNHIEPNDFWVILNQRVLDLSHLMKEINEIPCKDLTALHQLKMFGGTDMTTLFSERSKTKLELFELKSNSDYGKSNDLFWWNDPSYIIGGMTSRERNICVRNSSKGTQTHLVVCEEDSIYKIRAKFFSSHPEKNSENTVLRKNDTTCCPTGHLFLDKTLAENGLEWDPENEIVFLWMFHKDEFNTCQNYVM